MRIGEFIKEVNTTIDTVRHYEELGLIQPDKLGNRKNYTGKEVQQFQAIIEFKSAGFQLEDIRYLFNLKNAYGCGSEELINEAIDQLQQHLLKVEEEIKILNERHQNLSDTITYLIQELKPK